MRIINEDGQFVGTDKFIKGMVKEYYMEEGVLPLSFNKLSENEVKQLKGELILQEYTALVSSIVASFAKEIVHNVDDLITKSKTPALTKEQFSLATVTKGDISKIAGYKNVKELISFSKMINESIQSPSREQSAYLEALSEFEKLLGNMEKHAPIFKQVLEYERNNGASVASVDSYFGTSYYYALAMFAFQEIEYLYSHSLKANVDMNQKTPRVKSVYFEYDGSQSESVALAQIVNGSFHSGKARDFLKSLTTKAGRKNVIGTTDLTNGKPILEEVQYYSEKLLTENIGDVAFAFINSSKFFDLLLLPIYFLRYSVYMTKYFFKSYSDISDNIDKALRISKATDLPMSEFNKYKNEVESRNVKHSESQSMTFSKLDSHVKDDKVVLRKAQSNDSGNGGLII